jgi:hypothetical protein
MYTYTVNSHQFYLHMYFPISATTRVGVANRSVYCIEYKTSQRVDRSRYSQRFESTTTSI